MNQIRTIAPLLLAGMLAAPAAQACTGCNDKAAAAGFAPRMEANALTVVRDPDTGRLRAATAGEMAELLRAQQPVAASRRAAPRAAPTTPLVRHLANGTVRSRLTDEFSTYTVATRQADGSLTQVCVDTADAAATLVSQPAPVSKPAAAAATE